MLTRAAIEPKGKAAQVAQAMRSLVPVLTTARTRLRAPSYGDFPMWRDLFMVPDAKWLGGPWSAEDAWEEFTYYAGGWMMHGHGLWSVDRLDDGAHLGFVFVGLEWDDPDPDPELGYLFSPQTRGKGYASEASLAAHDFGLDLLGSGNLYSFIDRDNVASLALSRRIGGVETQDTDIRNGLGEQMVAMQFGITR